MGKNKGKGIEILEGEPKEIVGHQAEPPPGLPVAENVPVEIKTKKTTKERLEECLGNVLAIDDAEQIRGDLIGVGFNPTKRDAEKVVELLSGQSRGLIGRIADKLVVKYSEGHIDQLLKEGKFDEVVNESADEIKEELDMAVKDCYQKVWQEKKKRGKLATVQKENGLKLTEEIPGAITNEARVPAKLEIDKSGETQEQKELKEKIKVAIREAVDFILGQIDSRINEIKERAGALVNGGIDEAKLVSDREKIKNHILDNLLEGFAGLILQYLGGDYKSPHVMQTITIEARRMVSFEFGKSEELRKVMSKEKIPRDGDKLKDSSLIPKEDITMEKFPKKEITDPGAAETFTPDIDFREMSREEMVEKLARKIYDIRMSQDPNMNKFIPGPNLDLRGPAIDLMLGNQHITPRTPGAESYMRRWDRIQAEKWLKHLEREKYGRREKEAEKPAVAEPAPEPRAAGPSEEIRRKESVAKSRKAEKRTSREI